MPCSWRSFSNDSVNPPHACIRVFYMDTKDADWRVPSAQFALLFELLYSSRSFQNSSSEVANFVSPVVRFTVTKYNQSPSGGFMAALIADSPGLLIGVGGKPVLTRVLYGFDAS